MTRIVCASLMILLAAPAGAQQNTPGAGLRLDQLATVFVHDDRGAETRGTLLRLDRQSIVVLVDGQERTFELSTVRRVQKRGDSLKNGAIIGAVVGAVVGVMMGGFSDCPGSGSGCNGGARAAIALWSSGVYSAIGTGVDAAIQGRTTIYQRPAPTSVVPSSSTAAVRFTVSW